MFKIIESCSKLVSNCFPVDPDAIFQPGLIAQFKRKFGKIVCGVSDGSYCSGIIDDIKSIEDDSTLGSGLVTVWNVKGLIAETDQFCLESCFVNKSPLYVNQDGKLTTIKQSIYLHPVAEVLDFNLIKPKLKFKWLRNK